MLVSEVSLPLLDPILSVKSSPHLHTALL